MHNSSVLRWSFSVMMMAVMAGALLFNPAEANAQAGAAAQSNAVPGPEVCANCHAAQVASYQASKHSVKTDARTPANAGACSTCHGDATEHVKAGGGKGVGGMMGLSTKNMPAEAINKTCLTCHEGGKRMHWSQSLHASRDTSCASCHKVHQQDKVRSKLTEAEVCFACHKEQRAQINRPFRHPIAEGKVVCSDCHNPHGSVGPKSVKRDSTNETCYQCHIEKRGPYVRSHQPVTEDCGICHNPHGSTNPAMVKVRAPFLCQSCHDQASHHDGEATLGAGGRSAVFQARGCLNCHTQIHGSNAVSPTGTSSGRAFRR